MSRQTPGLILILFLTVVTSCSGNGDPVFTFSHGAIIRGDTTVPALALVFTGDEFGDGLEFISGMLEDEDINASFFLTGKFYRNTEFEPWIRLLASGGNYLGSHSDNHLLYCDWVKRDSLLVTRKEFLDDLEASYVELLKFGINKEQGHWFLPPYEWYNDAIASWTGEYGLQLINFTPGTRSNADYTIPEMGAGYVDSRTIFNSVLSYECRQGTGLNGFILLVHAGTDSRRTDKFYFMLPELVRELKARGYSFVRIDDLLKGTMINKDS
jgi:peptidoglycan/xylan/chitin deacetylase (PgdA/CDA1 family)